MIINHNISSIFANRQLKFNSQKVDKNIEKLSSGIRINHAGDDASNLAVSEKMRAQIRGLKQAQRNVENAISFIQTTEAYLQESQDILHRIRELAVQSANGIYTTEDRMQIQTEVSQLVDEVDRIAQHAQFNGLNVLTGRFSREFEASVGASASLNIGAYIQMGANMDQGRKIYISDMTATALGLADRGAEGKVKLKISLSTVDNANKTIGVIDKAMQKLNSERANLGAFQNRFEHVARGIATAAENIQAAESRIRDTDMALEVSNFVKNQILVQSSVAMLAQANVKPQSVLQLFR